MAADDIFCGECGFVARSVLAPVATSENDTVAITADPELSLGSMESALEPEPPELAKPDPVPFLGERFVLQFSTGESVTVRGTGLIGRNPAMEPGEYVDDLVAIVDEGKSVSKTHLEFGQEDGTFWVSDRFSTNGTVIRVSGSEPRRCEPQHRYLIERGGRVEIGDEFFVVI
jgi:pSer/pThr/pTyr-binding forkhead associated (FHA) protein